MRKEVKAFAEIMEQKLKENDHKTHWSHEDVRVLLEKLKLEVKELDTEVWDRTTAKAIQKECADVANFAMMIADNVKKL